MKLLEGLKEAEVADEAKGGSEVDGGDSSTLAPLAPKKVGIGVDCCITPIRHGSYSLVQTTDFFYPLVEDPYMQGRIAGANVLSDLYAMGVHQCDNVSLICGIPTKLTDDERQVVISSMLEGFRDCAAEGECSVRGGQIVPNPWMMIGGVASSVCANSEIVSPDGACVGDVLVLTKPIGTQIAVNAHQWMDQKEERWNRVKMIVTPEQTVKAFQRATSSMARLNRTGAKLMHKYGAHCATDVTGYGILGHAAVMAKAQKAEVSFVLHSLPVIANMVAVSKVCGIAFGLLQGSSAETSGGLLICLPKETAAAFCEAIESEEGFPAWIVGDVENGDKTARMIDIPKVIEVPSVEKEGELW